MQFRINLWIVTITFHLIDIDPTDRDLKLGITISW